MTTVRPTNDIATDGLINRDMPTSVEVFGCPIVEETETGKGITITLVFEENGSEEKIDYKGSYKLTRQPAPPSVARPGRRAGTDEESNSFKLELQLKKLSPVDTKYPSELNKTMVLHAQPDGFIRISSIPLTKEAENEFKFYLDYFQRDSRLLAKGEEALDMAVEPSLKHSLFQVYAFDAIKNKYPGDIKQIGADNYSNLAWKLKDDYPLKSNDPATVEGALVKYALNMRGQTTRIASTSPHPPSARPPQSARPSRPARPPQPAARPAQVASAAPPPPTPHPRQATPVAPLSPAPHPKQSPSIAPTPPPPPRQVASFTPPPPMSHPRQEVTVIPPPPTRPRHPDVETMPLLKPEPEIMLPAKPAKKPERSVAKEEPQSIQTPKREFVQPPREEAKVSQVAKAKDKKTEEKKTEEKRAKDKKAVKDKKLAALARGIAGLVRSQPAQPARPTTPARDIRDGGNPADDSWTGYGSSGLGFRGSKPSGTSGGYGRIYGMGVSSSEAEAAPSLGEKQKRFVPDIEYKDGGIKTLVASGFAEDPEKVAAREAMEGGLVVGMSIEDMEEEIIKQEKEIREGLARLSKMKTKNQEELADEAREAVKLIEEWQSNKLSITQYDGAAEQRFNSYVKQLESICKKRGLNAAYMWSRER